MWILQRIFTRFYINNVFDNTKRNRWEKVRFHKKILLEILKKKRFNYDISPQYYPEINLIDNYLFF